MAELEEQLEFPKQLLGQFMVDYQRYGKYNLEVQVPHLEKLAGFYERRYKLTKLWTDCVKVIMYFISPQYTPLISTVPLEKIDQVSTIENEAHALYNSISARDPQAQVWKHRAFKVQQEYWGDNCSISFEQQRTMTSSLKKELESIRNQSRTDMLAADQLANCFDGAALTSDQNTDFFACMRDISMECSEKMASFAGRIIKECVQLLNPAKPPCDFQAAAIGSIARGEATPYSDLEFFFLVGDKSKESVDYFERLAVTTYFQIANLAETKLSYMAISELKGWFDDRAKNGFKIDGLSDQAGNIPTGNGSPKQHNHFIVTPGDLVQRYQHILENPDKEKALRGDLTAMLSYMKTIYSHCTTKKGLREGLCEKIKEIIPNQERTEVNIEMLNTDVRKFNFRPSETLGLNGFAVDVKREIYRFPSILLLDICIVTQTTSTSSWESLGLLHDKGLISPPLYHVLQILLAAATYVRLSAYLHHDSQDDRMSVGHQIADNQTISNTFISQRRWFMPHSLFVEMCSHMIQLRSAFDDSINIGENLKNLVTSDNLWSNIETLFYTTKYTEALALLIEAYGKMFVQDPLCVISDIPSGLDELNILFITSETLRMCEEHRAALTIYEYLTTNGIRDASHKAAVCYAALGDLKKAVDILESITDKTGEVYYSLGDVYGDMKEYDKSEQSFLQALELWYCDISSEKQYDYYGEEVEEPKKLSKIGFSKLKSSEETLSLITNGSNDVGVCVIALGLIYSNQRHYKLSNDYYTKALHLITELHGTAAAVPNAAHTLGNLGNNHRTMGEYIKAEDYYKQALAVYQELSQGDDSCYIARTLYNLGVNYNRMGKNNDAEDYYKQALAVYRELSQGADSSDIARTLDNLGDNYYDIGQYSEAVDYYKQALAVYRELSQGADSSDIARTLHSLGVNYNRMGKNNDAEDYYKQALAVYRELSQGADSSGIARTLGNLGVNYNAMGQYIAAEDYYKQALAVYRELSQGADSISIADTLYNLGNNYTAMEQYSDAEDYYKQALAVYRELSQGADSSDIARTLYNLGYNYRDAGDESKAIETLRESLDMTMRGDPDNPRVERICRYLVEKGSLFDEVMTDKIPAALPKLARKLNKKGQKHYRRKEYTQAEECYRQVLEVYRALSDSSSIALTLSNLACIYMDMGDRSKADEMFREAIDLYTDIETGDKQISRICHYLTLCTESNTSN